MDTVKRMDATFLDEDNQTLDIDQFVVTAYCHLGEIASLRLLNGNGKIRKIIRKAKISKNKKIRKATKIYHGGFSWFCLNLNYP